MKSLLILCLLYPFSSYANTTQHDASPLDVAQVISLPQAPVNAETPEASEGSEELPAVEALEILPQSIDAPLPTQNIAGQPQNIALLLPLSGKNADPAKAIAAGFLASQQRASHRPTVRIYDTTQASLSKIYRNALNEGADFVVGPLTKEEVLQLSKLSLRTPVLALNYHPSIQTKDLVQFALAPEAEAEQLAEKAWQRGARHVGLIAPDNTWGKRNLSAFSARWQQLGGHILHTAYINASQEYAAAVARLLGISETQKRDEKPSRRQDLDAIIMVATPDAARQLKPLLDFYYAEDLPVYATSSIYGGRPDPTRDRDLNGIIFSDMPWLLEARRGAHVRELLRQQEGGPQSDQYNRLFAMGVDAYQLTQHWHWLHTGHYPGATGNLSLRGNTIARTLSFAKMKNGEPVPIH